MDIYAQMAQKIIIAQEGIIGPVAIEQAGKVTGLKVDWSKKDVTFTGDKKATLGKLVEQYKALFGQASVEMCRDAVHGISSQIPQDELPGLLK